VEDVIRSQNRPHRHPLQVEQVKPAGVHTPDECIPAEAYIAELRKRGIDIKELS